MSDEVQALCFLAGANSIFYGDEAADHRQPRPRRRRPLFERLGIVRWSLSANARAWLSGNG